MSREEEVLDILGCFVIFQGEVFGMRVEYIQSTKCFGFLFHEIMLLVLCMTLCFNLSIHTYHATKHFVSSEAIQFVRER